MVELEAREHLLVSDAATRIAVDLLDQLLDRLAAVAHDVARHAARDRHQLAVDHEHAVVEALDEALDDDRAAAFARVIEGRAHLIVVRQADRDALAVVGVERLCDHGVADLVRRAHGLRRVVDQLLARNRQPQVAEDAVGLLLVGSQLHRDVPGLAGDRGLDALLVATEAQLHQAVAVEAQAGHVPRARRAHQRGGARTQRASLCVLDEAVALLREVEVLGDRACRLQLPREERVQQDDAEPCGLEADLLVLVLEDHVVLAGHAVRAGAAEADLRAGHVLQLDGHVLQHVS